MAIDLKAFSPLQALKGAGLTAVAPAATAATGVPTGGKDFLSMVKDAAQDAVKTGQKAEALSVAGVAGQADLLDVVRAVGNAEFTLQTVVAVRDKMVNAYQELLRMPI
ncbi:MAG: flagellar hook-basal body complex protein FliE [Alphaproteobacteria bacterium]|nr:flagellar hook-basal body complex protein FliE [Alphaproteobacteria bacterium]